MNEDRYIVSGRRGKMVTLAMLAVAMAALVYGVAMWAFFMHTVSVEPGFHAVINDKPYFFGREGVRPQALTEGRVLLFKTSTATVVKTTPQSETVKVDDYASADNILLDFETTVQYRIANAVDLVKNFGDGWFNHNVRNQYLAVVREAVKKYTMTQMMSDVAVAQKIDDEITAGLQKLVKDSALPIQVISVSTGRAKPNPAVLEQMNQTAAEQQRKKTLVEATTAEEQREKEQTAKARADNAYRNAMNLTPEMYVQLEAVKRFSEACKVSTCVINAGGGNGGVLVSPGTKK